MYKLGTIKEFETLQQEIETMLKDCCGTKEQAEQVLLQLKINLQILDENYGPNRNWQAEGGYAILFKEPTEDSNNELQALLQQYNQTTECKEVDMIITTMESEIGIIDWVNEVYLIGTEYALIAIRARPREAFDIHTPKYLSRDIAEYLPMEFHALLYGSIEKMRKQTEKLDWLQIFELSVEEKEGILILKHKQEVPPKEQTTLYVVSNKEHIFRNKEKWNNKTLYVIDDGIAVTTVFPYER